VRVEKLSVAGARGLHGGAAELFDWYRPDFGSPKRQGEEGFHGGCVEFIGRYRADGSLLRQGKGKIRYFAYDWGINEAQVEVIVS
jgi:hypothetical protein